MMEISNEISYIYIYQTYCTSWMQQKVNFRQKFKFRDIRIQTRVTVSISNNGIHYIRNIPIKYLMFFVNKIYHISNDIMK